MRIKTKKKDAYYPHQFSNQGLVLLEVRGKWSLLWLGMIVASDLFCKNSRLSQKQLLYRLNSKVSPVTSES